MNLFFVVFCLIVLLPNSMSKLIHSRCKLTCMLSYKIILYIWLQTNTELGPCFYVLVSKTKGFFRSRSTKMLLEKVPCYFSKTKSNPAKKITGLYFSADMKTTGKNSATLEQNKNNQDCHLSPFMTSLYSYSLLFSSEIILKQL